MDRSDSHQPFDVTTIASTYVPESATAPNAQTVNESNRVETQVAPVVEPGVEPVVQPQGEPDAASEAALVPAQPSSNPRPYTDVGSDLKSFFFQLNYDRSFCNNLLTFSLYPDDLRRGCGVERT